MPTEWTIDGFRSITQKQLYSWGIFNYLLANPRGIFWPDGKVIKTR